MINIKEAIVVFGFGGIIYGLIEVVFRGFTHWSMVIAGGIIFTLIYLLNQKIQSRSLIPRCFFGSIIITAVEFIVGCIVNLQFDMHVWDYSNEKYNILGQICPLFSIVWFLLCIPATLLAFSLKKALRKNDIS